MTQDQYDIVKGTATKALWSAFLHVPDKSQAWQDLHRLTQDKNIVVRASATEALGSAFLHVPDKGQAWQDLHRLTQDESDAVRWSAVKTLASAIPFILDKDRAWQDLVRLTQDQSDIVKGTAAKVLVLAFPHVPDKGQAWQDLIWLIQDENSSVKWNAVEALRLAFSHVPDKGQAWQDLVNLSQEKDLFFCWSAFNVLRSNFLHVPDKVQAWQDLHRLTQDENSYVRAKAAEALGLAYPNVPDKGQAWQDLIRLTQDMENYVRTYAYHSLGKASVYRATESKDINDLRIYLDEAVRYFEKSTEDPTFSPAIFCHLFYRTYSAIIFNGASHEAIRMYFSEAKKAVGVCSIDTRKASPEAIQVYMLEAMKVTGGSKSKNELLTAVENLAKALQEVQRLKDRPLQEVLRDLKAYEWYCTQAEMYMNSVEDEAPGAVKLLRKGNIWIKENIEATIREIQDYARQICQVTHDKGLEAEAFCCQVEEAAGSLSGEDITKTLRSIFDFSSLLREKCKLLPEGEKELVQSQLNDVDDVGAIPEKLDGIKKVVKFFLSRVQEDGEFLRKLGEIKEKMDIIHQDIKSLRQSLLDRFDLSEQKILSSVFERYDRDKLEIVDVLLRAVESNAIPPDLIAEILSVTKDIVTEIRTKQLDIQDPEAAESLNSWEEAINSQELGIENTIKVTIPIIPFLLTYEASYKFQAGMKLDSIWGKLSSLVWR